MPLGSACMATAQRNIGVSDSSDRIPEVAELECERLFLHLLTVATKWLQYLTHIFSALSPRVDHGYFLRDYYLALTPTAVFGYDLAPYPVPS
jgi:hypothetical protein